MRKKSFQIALAGVSGALAVVFLTLGNWFSFLTITGYFFSSVALMLPLAEDSRWGAFLAYLAAAILGFLFGGIWNPWKMFLYCVFFGLHPIVNSFQKKWNLNRWVCLLVKAIWFDVMLWIAWTFAYEAFFDGSINWMEKIGNWIYLIIGAGGTVFFVFYDFLIMYCQKVVNAFVAKISHRSGKGGKSNGKKTPDIGNEGAEEIFDLGSPEDGNGPDSEKKVDRTPERRKDRVVFFGAAAGFACGREFCGRNWPRGKKIVRQG